MITNEKILSWTEDNDEFLYYKGIYLFSFPEENIDFESLINNQKFIDFIQSSTNLVWKPEIECQEDGDYNFTFQEVHNRAR